MMKNITYIFIIFMFFSCSDKAKVLEINPKRIDIVNQEFKNPKAEKINDDAVVLSKSGKHQDAEIEFLKALKLEPENPTILNNLGVNSSYMSDYIKSIEYCKESLKVSDSTYFMAGVNLGLTYKNMGEFEKGIGILNFVIDNCSDKTILISAYVNRALNLLEFNNCEDARKDLEYLKLNRIESMNIENFIEHMEYALKNCVQQRI